MLKNSRFEIKRKNKRRTRNTQKKKKKITPEKEKLPVLA
jgi:hypothetical protein